MKPSLIFLLLSSGVCYADYSPTRVSWNGVQVSTSEGMVRKSDKLSYPITNLFDGNPKTAWVFRGPGPEANSVGPDRVWRHRFAIQIELDHAVTIDGVRLMNGYNKDRRTFYRNNRATEIEVFPGARYEERHAVVRSLSDRMGWHTVRWKPVRTGSVILYLTRFNKGRDNDVAISELQLLSKGRPMKLKMPKVVWFTDGSECGCGTVWTVIDRTGKVLAKKDAEGEGGEPTWNKSLRYMLGIESRLQGARVWVIDSKSGERVYHRELRQRAKKDQHVFASFGQSFQNGSVEIFGNVGQKEFTDKIRLPFRYMFAPGRWSH